MGEITANTTQEKAPKKSWFKGLKSEFKKIAWPDKETLVKESAAVIVVTVILGFVIALVDMAIEYGVDFIL
ncbi:MAG: preprotein translocase subunit SecE [Lachnospiraceae bacterium]|nr:preprotein translocase subunit SecE [Lachnospiraceae bacterium]